jgi:hypothetical protein
MQKPYLWLNNPRYGLCFAVGMAKSPRKNAFGIRDILQLGIYPFLSKL